MLGILLAADEALHLLKGRSPQGARAALHGGSQMGGTGQSGPSGPQGRRLQLSKLAVCICAAGTPAAPMHERSNRCKKSCCRQKDSQRPTRTLEQAIGRWQMLCQTPTGMSFDRCTLVFRWGCGGGPLNFVRIKSAVLSWFDAFPLLCATSRRIMHQRFFPPFSSSPRSGEIFLVGPAVSVCRHCAGAPLPCRPESHEAARE